jgi:hypothetical protein
VSRAPLNKALGVLTMIPSTEFLEEAEERLAQALSDYETPQRSAAAVEFYQLRLQAAIFNYDICRTIAGLLRDEPKASR